MAFDFNQFISQMNSQLDKLLKEKKEKESRDFEYKKSYDTRQMDLIQRQLDQNHGIQSRQMDLQKKQYDDAADNEYYRRKHLFDVQAGNMNPDTYAGLYGGMAAGDDGSGNLRGKRGKSGQVGDKEILELITKAYENRDPTDKTHFEDFVGEMLPKMRSQFGVKDIDERTMSAGDAWVADKKRRDMDFNQNVSMSRDAAGKMRFGINQTNADAITGWGDVKSNVQKNRLNNPRIAPNSNMQGSELAPTQTMGQYSNDIYNGARRNMMSPVAVSPTTQPSVANNKQKSWLDKTPFDVAGDWFNTYKNKSLKNVEKSKGSYLRQNYSW